MARPSRVRVAVLFGGRSSEHAISCVSAAGVLGALDPQRYEVVPVGITRAGRFVLAPADPRALAMADGRLPAVADDPAALLLPATPGDQLVLMEPGVVPKELGTVDVVFPLLHGPYGEDGTVQGLLELAGVPYVGSGVLASAVAMDKEFMKLVLAARGLPVGRFAVLAPGAAPLSPEVQALGLPVFVKPARGGSSIGISKVRSYDALAAAVAAAREHDPKVIVEAALAGREVECGVLAGTSGAPPEASLPAEVRVTGGQEFYDFEAKYLDAATEFDLPANLPPGVTAAVQAASVQAFAALGCAGLARVDFFVFADGSLVVNEVNTLPGFTPQSMYPRMWAASGVTYPELVGRLVEAALEAGTGLR